jgi:hypothetical protein
MTDAETIAELRWILQQQSSEILQLRAALQAERARRDALPNTKDALRIGSTPFLDWLAKQREAKVPT